MTAKSILKAIGNNLLLFFALMGFIGLVTALSTGVWILLSLLGVWLGIGKDIFVYFALFYVFYKSWNVLGWAVGKIADRIERKEEREYFERLNKGK